MTFPRKGLSAAILAGGLGTRLRPVVGDRPKVLAPVAGRPFLEFLLTQLVRAGIPEVTLLVGYGSDQVQTAFGNSYRNLKLNYSTERSLLGTGGALRLALPLLSGDTILILNGDSYCDTNIEELAAVHESRRAAATLALAKVPDGSRYGRVIRGEGGRIERFEEKGGPAAPAWINAGVYLFDRRAVEGIEPDRVVSLERDVLPSWVGRGQVFGVPAGRFIDIGTPESFAEAAEFFGRLSL